MRLINAICLPQYWALFVLACASLKAQAEWSAEVNSSGYYTDDVALFSVTRRLSLKDDPTQPTVDRPGQGADFVYEPGVTLTGQAENTFGKALIALDASGYIFASHSAFSHGLYELRLAQTFTSGAKISLHYNYLPDLFLGQNAYRQINGEETERDEKLTSHYWSLRFDQPLTQNLTVRLFSRYGLRNYNEPFQHRDTQFWTIGPHLQWIIQPNVELLMGYHYERGKSDQQRAAHFPDDVSYINHYASAELKIHWLEKLSSNFIFDYETNQFTSRRLDDEHLGAAENVFQGEIELLYELDEAAIVKLGWQHGSRKLTSEQVSIKNNNVWLGLEYEF